MNIDLTNREIELLMGCIGTNIETVKRRHDPADPMIAELIEELFELETDLREALHRRDDFGVHAVDVEVNTENTIDPEDPDLFMDPVEFAVKHDAETQMFNAGVEAREKVKANKAPAVSRAQDRRTFNMKRRDSRLSKTQTHDVWDANDPKNW